MPSYEMPLLLRVMNKPEIATTLKRTAVAIFNGGGIIRKIENLGVQDLPYKTSSHGSVHKKASQFIFYFDVPAKNLGGLLDQYGRDRDIIRNFIFKTKEPSTEPCTLEEELLPPAYRPDVQKMVEIADRADRKRKKFKYNSGLNYYPFQK